MTAGRRTFGVDRRNVVLDEDGNPVQWLALAEEHVLLVERLRLK
jgi:hypothetical protein